VIGAQRRASCVKARLHYELVRIGSARTGKMKMRFGFHLRRIFSAHVRELSSNFGAVETQTNGIGELLRLGRRLSIGIPCDSTSRA
jgi:hypothetical protein